MRRPINWIVFALSLGFLAFGRSLQQSSHPAPMMSKQPRFLPVAEAMPPAAARGREDLEFGYVERDR